jgi:hypothetical protein
LRLPVSAARLVEGRSDEQDRVAVLNEIRDRLLNQKAEYFAEVQTDDNALTTIWFDSLPPDSVAHLVIHTAGLRDDSSEAAGYSLWSTWRRDGTGAATVVGAGTIVSNEDVATWTTSVTAGPSTGDVSVQVRGATGSTVNWRAHISALVYPWR